MTPAGTEAPAETGEERINSLLSQDQPGGEGTERAPEDTSVADADLGAREAGTAEGAVAVAEPETEEASGAGEAEPGEAEFEVTDRDADFSDDAYVRAAAHYSKQAGKQLDPNDRGDRFLLRELMQRGQRIRALQEDAERAAEEAGKGEPGKPAEEAAAPVEPAKLTAEQLRQRVSGARAYAKSQIVPEVALEFARGMVDAIWPGKDAGKNITQEQANNIAEVFSTFAILQIADAIPSILSAAPQAVLAGDPMMARMRDMATREAAIDELLDATGKDGNPAFPDFDRLVETGAIKKVMASDELKDAIFNKDPYKNLVAKLKFAYRVARGQSVDVGALEKAAQRGREAEAARTRAVGAGKLPPGSTKGGFSAPSPARRFINTLVQDSGSRFHRAIEASRAK